MQNNLIRKGEKMKLRNVIILLALIALLVAGCTRNSAPAGYASYGQQGQQQPYVGGGCGVAPVSDLGELPLKVSELITAA